MVADNTQFTAPAQLYQSVPENERSSTLTAHKPTLSPNEKQDARGQLGTPPHGNRVPAGNKPYLCNDCRKIDFTAIFSTSYDFKKSRSVTLYELDYIEPSLFNQKCPLCDFFLQMRAWHDEFETWITDSRTYSLQASSALQMFSSKQNMRYQSKRLFDICNQPILSVFPSDCMRQGYDGHRPWPTDFGLILPTTDAAFSDGRLSGRDLRVSSIDYNVIKEWIHFCSVHHRKACQSSSRTPILGFRVIDCEERTIVPLPNDKEYAALSYLWGADSPKQQAVNGAHLNQTFPVIEDAMKAAKSIGFRFLWVDRYCINQDNAEEMHIIYEDAGITIIAGAGEGPEFGLPGVSTPRHPQSKVQVGDYMLVSTLDLRSDIAKSKWNTRAWTYQEALLSRRRLVFTPR